MPLYFIDSTTGNDANSGLTLDLAFATIDHFYTGAGLSAGDHGVVRRIHSETPASDILPIYDGTYASPITLYGLPRDAHTISSSDWTNGSTGVVVDDADMDREKHQGRFITAPDGCKYLITRVTDASNIVIDREYAGSTVSNDATASIDADDVEQSWEDYDDSADTIKKSTWEADADDLPVLDFNDGDFQLYFQDDTNHIIKNLEIKDSADSTGIVRIRRCQQFAFVGCLIKQSANNSLLIDMQESFLYFNRTIIEGSGAGTSQRGTQAAASIGGFIHFKNGAIYNMGDNGVASSSQMFFENFNVGVEVANGDDDISIYELGYVYGRDLKLGGTNGDVLFSQNPANRLKYFSIENYGKVLGEHENRFLGGSFKRAAVSGETPNKKVSDYVLKIIPSTSGFKSAFPDWVFPIMVHELEMTAAAHTLKYWIYNDSGVTINDGDAKADLWLKVEYIDSYDDTSEYTIVELFSAENTILDAADADDWDSLSVTLTPAVAGKVRLTIYLNFYSAAGTLFVDPAVVIS